VLRCLIQQGKGRLLASWGGLGPLAFYCKSAYVSLHDLKITASGARGLCPWTSVGLGLRRLGPYGSRSHVLYGPSRLKLLPTLLALWVNDAGNCGKRSDGRKVAVCTMECTLHSCTLRDVGSNRNVLPSGDCIESIRPCTVRAEIKISLQYCSSARFACGRNYRRFSSLKSQIS